jgi:predicted outer membrane protein
LETPCQPRRALAASALAAVLLSGSAAAQTGDVNPPPASQSDAASQRELTEHFVATALPAANFISHASRMASTNSQNNKLRELAGELAKSQNTVAVSLAGWVNVSTSVVTRRSPYTGSIGNGTARLSAPALLPAQVHNLQRLSAARGPSFDSLYISTVKEALDQLQTLYKGYDQPSADPGLKAIADRELPEVEKTMNALDHL